MPTPTPTPTAHTQPTGGGLIGGMFGTMETVEWTQAEIISWKVSVGATGGPYTLSGYSTWSSATSYSNVRPMNDVLVMSVSPLLKARRLYNYLSIQPVSGATEAYARGSLDFYLSGSKLFSLPLGVAVEPASAGTRSTSVIGLGANGTAGTDSIALTLLMPYNSQPNNVVMLPYRLWTVCDQIRFTVIETLNACDLRIFLACCSQFQPNA